MAFSVASAEEKEKIQTKKTVSPMLWWLEHASVLLLLLLRDHLDLGVSCDEQHHLDDHHHDCSA